MIPVSNALKKVEQLKELLVRKATGKSLPEDDEKFANLRREIFTFSEIQEHLPDFVKTHRTLNEFWQYIQPRFATYKERREYLREEFGKVLSALENKAQVESQISTTNNPTPDNVFQRQFPAGLPFGLQKPSLVVKPYHGQQQLYFEEEPQIGVIKGNAYPNFTYSQLDEQLQGTPIIETYKNTFAALLSFNQTQKEMALFLQYSNSFKILTDEVPVLIPQAWIQWHSKTKQDLRALSSPYASDLYRVDFVVFWGDKRFAVLVDDISHYAKKINSEWRADEEAYSKRLREDRKLRKEGWIVFRVSNWEMRVEDHVKEILEDLRETIGF